MPLVPIFFGGLLAVAILILFLGLSQARSTSSPVQERLQMYGTRPRTLEEIELDQPFSERAIPGTWA